MRVEGDVEFRIYCEDAGGCPIHIVTQGVLNLFEDLYNDAHPREADEASEQRGASLPNNVIPMLRTNPVNGIACPKSDL